MEKSNKYEKLKKPKIKFTKDQGMQKKIRSILGYDDDILNKKENSKLKINYDKTVYFDQNNFTKNDESEKQIKKFISNVFNNTSNPPIFDKLQKGSNIKFNFNINNNFYNSSFTNNNQLDQNNFRNTYTEKMSSSNLIGNFPNNNINNSGNKRNSHVNFQNNNDNFSSKLFFYLYFFMVNFLIILLDNLNANNKLLSNTISLNDEYGNERENLIEDESIPQTKASNYRSHQYLNNFKNSDKYNNPLQSSQQSFISTTTKNQNTNVNNNINFIPCINCNNIINIEDIGIFKIYLIKSLKIILLIIYIDSHSNICHKVKEEVIQAETSQFTFHANEYKLNKLLEHISSIKNGNSNPYSISK